MSASCQVCGHAPSWNDILTGDIICQGCAEWAEVVRFLIYLTGRPVVVVEVDVIREELEKFPNGVVRGDNVTLGEVH